MNLAHFDSVEPSHTTVAEPCENSLTVVRSRGKLGERRTTNIIYEISVHTGPPYQCKLQIEKGT